MACFPKLKPLGAITTVDDSDPRYVARVNEEIPMKDGGRIRANVCFPRERGPRWPVIMSSSPYGKDVDVFTAVTTRACGAIITEDQKCKHVRYEAPSPAFWCPAGYILLYWDHRGSSQSPGYLKPFSSDHFDDYAEIVTWASKQQWSSGKIGLSGISYLALNQWATAVRQPEGLAAIMPWEGFSDYYRDACRHGGIFCDGLSNRWYRGQAKRMQYGSRNRANGNVGPDSPEGVLDEELLAKNIDDTPRMTQDNEWIDDEYYQERTAREDLSKIQVPLLCAGNWVRFTFSMSSEAMADFTFQGSVHLHLRGGVLGWMRAGSKHKFLRLHSGRHDKPYYVSPGIDVQRSFFDCFLRGDDHGGWTSNKQPKVSLALRRGSPEPVSHDGERITEWRDEQEWPLARTTYLKMYLSADRTLNTKASQTQDTLSYRGFSGEGIKFETAAATEAYEFCGHGSVRLSMSLSNHAGENPADIDVFLALRKLDSEGRELSFTAGNGTATAVTYGWIRASHRTLTTKPYPELEDGVLPFPTLSHLQKDRKPVENDTVYDLLTELWPTQLLVAKGERLVLEVSPQDPQGTGEFTHANPVDRNVQKLGGTNNIHFGPGYENYLVLPIV